MATTITAQPFGISAGIPRVKVNKHLWITPQPLGLASGMGAARVGAGIGPDILTVNSWDPANGSVNVEHLSPFQVNFEQNTGTNEHTVLYDDGTSGDLWSGGILTNVVPYQDGIRLDTNSPIEDFDDLSGELGTNSGWIWCGKTYQAFVGDHDTGKTGKEVRWVLGNQFGNYRWSDAGNIAEGEAFVRMRCNKNNNNCGILFYAEGSGSALRAYRVSKSWSSTWAYWHRMYDEDSTWGLTTNSWAFGTPNTTDWYWLGARWVITGGGTSVTCYAKFWKDGDAEPGWTWGNSDTWRVNPSTANVGLGGNGSATSSTFTLDDFSVVPTPAQYYSSGNWESGAIDVSAVGIYSHALIGWTPTTPTDTAIAVKSRWNPNDSWDTCTNGEQIPGIRAGREMSVGSIESDLELRVELSTTDTEASPIVENLEVYFEPVANDVVEIELGSAAEITCSEAEETLDIWGKRQISGGSNIIAWDDITAETYQPYRLWPAGGGLQAKLVYNGVDIELISVTLMPNYWMVSDAFTGFQLSLEPIKYASAPVEGRWNCQTPWAPTGHAYDWVLVDYTMGMRADAKFLVGHYQLDDHPASLIAAALELNDHPASLIARGYRRDDHFSSLLVQGPRSDDQPAMLMPAIQSHDDFVGSFVVATVELSDNPAMFLVYGVNRDGAIFVNVVNDTTYAKLVAEGIVMT